MDTLIENKNRPISFALQGIKTEQFAIFEDHHIPKKETGLGTEIQFKINPENQEIGVFLGFEFMQGKKVFLKIMVSCHFKIEEGSWNCFIDLKKDKIIVPQKFLTHLAMITTGTTRGVLYAKVESTPFSKYIIPTLNVDELITEDVSFDFIKE